MLSKAALEKYDKNLKAGGGLEELDVWTAKEESKRLALQIYQGEFKSPKKTTAKSQPLIDITSMNRSALRFGARKAVLDSSVATKKGPQSVVASSINSGNKFIAGNDLSALRQLQADRILLTRLGFPDKAVELDEEIEKLRIKVRQQRKKIEKAVTDKNLNKFYTMKTEKIRLSERKLKKEIRDLEKKCAEEEKNIRDRQERAFLALLEDTTRKATGKAKKCSCEAGYLCKHNKTASYKY